MSYSSSAGWDQLEQVLDVGLPTVGEIGRHTAGADVVMVHAKAGDLLKEPENFLSFPPAVDHHRHGAEVHAVGGHEQQMRAHAVEFAHQHADPHSTLRDFDAKELLGREAERQLGEEWRGVVHAGDVGTALQVGELLSLLLHPRVEIADNRLAAQDGFALHLEHEAQHAVGRRVRRTHVEKDPLIFIGPVRVSADHCGFGFAQAENRGVVATTLHPLGAVKNLRVFGDRHRSLLAALNCTGIEPMA